jgi:protein SCO1
VRIGTKALIVPSVVAMILAGACTKSASKLPNYGTVPPFQLTDSKSHAFDSKALKGKLWIADFIYVSCPGPCSRMTSQMRKVHEHVNGQKDVWLVSISVDPQHDSPPVLDDFADRFGGAADNWAFLTGSPETIHVLAHEVFHVGDLISKMDHSTKFMLVDTRGDIRGYYSSLDAEGMPAILRDLAVLRKENS